MAIENAESEMYIYECTTFSGDIVYCKYVNHNHSGIIGTTEDGTTILITSYKRISKEE